MPDTVHSRFSETDEPNTYLLGFCPTSCLSLPWTPGRPVYPNPACTLPHHTGGATTTSPPEHSSLLTAPPSNTLLENTSLLVSSGSGWGKVWVLGHELFVGYLKTNQKLRILNSVRDKSFCLGKKTKNKKKKL